MTTIFNLAGSSASPSSFQGEHFRGSWSQGNEMEATHNEQDTRKRFGSQEQETMNKNEQETSHELVSKAKNNRKTEPKN